MYVNHYFLSLKISLSLARHSYFQSVIPHLPLTIPLSYLLSIHMNGYVTGKRENLAAKLLEDIFLHTLSHIILTT